MTRKELFGEMVGKVSGFTVKAGDEKATITWTDPEDKVYQDVPMVWAGDCFDWRVGLCSGGARTGGWSVCG